MPHLSKTQYLLMNKDTPLLAFSCRKNEFDEPELTVGLWQSDLRPIGLPAEAGPTELTSYLERRKAPKHRQHLQELLRRFGCEDLEGFLRVTHALSLNDAIWVKEAGSPLHWADVSLYENEFDQLISEAAFDGTISSTELSSTSPEFGTDGYFAKCWVREDRGIFLYKSGSALHEIEPLSEYLAYQLAQALCPDAVPYDLAFYHGKLVSKCPLFTDEHTGLAKAARVFDGKEKTIPELLSYFESIGGGDAFRRMCVLDAVILNPDRHYGNFGVLFENDTMKILGMAPVFDNNRALLPGLDDGQILEPDWYIERCQSKLGRDFITNAKGLMTDAIRADLKNLAGFQFSQHPEISASQSRLDALSATVQHRIRAIL
ncbi:hypothetical protein SDC9_78732 [bioreactor metagenome]|uniref:HipA-like C-terminal domain-containing protein n=1 Tax=bioreactor metagenome TaxID=1076179 RepID=A0A644Z0A5_9ZZZZ